MVKRVLVGGLLILLLSGAAIFVVVLTTSSRSKKEWKTSDVVTEMDQDLSDVVLENTTVRCNAFDLVAEFPKDWKVSIGDDPIEQRLQEFLKIDAHEDAKEDRVPCRKLAVAMKLPAPQASAKAIIPNIVLWAQHDSGLRASPKVYLTAMQRLTAQKLTTLSPKIEFGRIRTGQRMGAGESYFTDLEIGDEKSIRHGFVRLRTVKCRGYYLTFEATAQSASQLKELDDLVQRFQVGK